MSLSKTRLTLTAALVVLGAAGLGAANFAQEHQRGGEHSREGSGEHSGREGAERSAPKTDADKLLVLVQQSRADLAALRTQAGLPGARERRGEHGEGSREGRGEHGGGEGGEGEEGGKRVAKTETWNATRNGAHLVLAYDPAAQSFRGSVQNKSKQTLADVRVEVHLSNGVELGPTKRTDLAPGAKLEVELAAAGQEFTWWTTHPEHGSEEGHGPGHEGERGEGDGRPKDAALRPVFNQLQLLRNEIRRTTQDLKNKKR